RRADGAEQHEFIPAAGVGAARRCLLLDLWPGYGLELVEQGLVRRDSGTHALRRQAGGSSMPATARSEFTISCSRSSIRIISRVDTASPAAPVRHSTATWLSIRTLYSSSSVAARSGR